MKALTIASLTILLAACGGRTVDLTTSPDSPSSGGGSIAWGPQVGDSGLSEVSGARDAFASDLGAALARAALTRPNGASQSSDAEDGRTAREMTVDVEHMGGNLVYGVSDGSFIGAQVPSPAREGLELAMFADVPANIEPDPSSYQHELLGLWAWNGEVGAFWSASPSVPQAGFGSGYPTGRATFSGDAVGLHATGGAPTKFLADVALNADFDTGTVGGTVDKFRSFAGTSLGTLSVTLAPATITQDGAPFSESTSATVGTGAGVEGGGHWGARWSDGAGESLGGTFGFAATVDGGVAVLGAFSANSRAPTTGGNPDDTVSTTP